MTKQEIKNWERENENEIQIRKNDPDWALVCDVLHYNGAHHKALTAKELYQVYCEGDGYGYIPRAELLKINDGWDWSHIRDSSREAVIRMAKTIRGILTNQYGLQATYQLPPKEPRIVLIPHTSESFFA